MGMALGRGMFFGRGELAVGVSPADPRSGIPKRNDCPSIAGVIGSFAVPNNRIDDQAVVGSVFEESVIPAHP
jgi:hypothetical protein